jgi:hypothetical protein
MVKFTKKGTLLLVAAFALIFGFAALYEGTGVAELFVAILLVVLAVLVRRLTARNNSLSSVQPQSASDEDDNEFGGTLDQLLDDLETFEQEHMGWHGVHISRTNAWIKSYMLPSLDGETFLFYSIIPKDKDTGSHIHIVVETNTGIIVQHGPVLLEREYIWPFDYCPVVESLREAQMVRRSSSIRETLKAMGHGQLEGDYTDLVADKDIQDQDQIVNTGGGSGR